MPIAKRYFRMGVPSIDEDSPDQPVQGLTLAVYEFDTDANRWSLIRRDQHGKVYLGYKAQEITPQEYELWQSRIEGALHAGPDGYQDHEGVWFPGMIGPGLSVLDEAGHAEYENLRLASVAAAAERERQAQSLTPRQAREALIRLGRDDEVEAAVDAIADPVERKIVRNWFEFTTEWVYGHPVLTQFAAALNFDKDEFFALAKTL